MPEKNELENNDVKKWKGIKEDAATGQFIVYITESTDHVFDSIDEAVDYMTKADKRESMSVEAGAPEFSGVQRGQENIDGVKQVTITRKVVEDEEGKWKVREKTRTDIIKENEQEAKSAYKNIEDAKEEAESVENPFEEDDVKKEGSIQPIGHCGKCGAAIYPPGISSKTMAPWFNRQIPADVFCPACGYGIGEPTNFIYANEELNEKSVEKFSELSKSSELAEFSMPLRDIDLDIDKDYLFNLIKESGNPINDDTSLYLEYSSDSSLKWTFDPSGNSYGIESFRIRIPSQTISVNVRYPYFENPEDEDPQDISVDIDIPLDDVDVSADSINMESGTLYPSKLEIYPGTSVVIF